MQLVYGELRKLAVVRMANEKPGQTAGIEISLLFHPKIFQKLVARLGGGKRLERVTQ